MRNYRRFCAVLLLLTLLCGCAAEKAVTTVSLPGETNAAAETQSTSALENTAQSRIRKRRLFTWSFKGACRRG